MNYNIKEFREAMDLYCLYRNCSDCPMNTQLNKYKLCNYQVSSNEKLSMAAEILIRDGYLQPLVEIKDTDIMEILS